MALIDGLLQSAARQASQAASASNAPEQSSTSDDQPLTGGAGPGDADAVQVATVDSFQVWVALKVNSQEHHPLDVSGVHEADTCYVGCIWYACTVRIVLQRLI